MPELKNNDLEKVSGGKITTNEQPEKDLPVSKSKNAFEEKDDGEIGGFGSPKPTAGQRIK